MDAIKETFNIEAMKKEPMKVALALGVLVIVLIIVIVFFKFVFYPLLGLLVVACVLYVVWRIYVTRFQTVLITLGWCALASPTTRSFYTCPSLKRALRLLSTALTLALVSGEVTGLGPQHRLPDGGEIKVVLVAGSSGYFNYRHQADVCHAYQILHSNGIPDENIIVMMYDDIANSSENPEKGVIINRPGGPNVYEGVPKDYVGKEVTKENFFNVLMGNETALKGIGSGRTLKSGPNDHVFVNFVDHGGPGVLLMPDEEIKANELIEVLESMSENARFSKMFLYIEACESGSIFDNLLPDDLNIFVMTAADPHESSYACFYDEKLQTYLGDVFSVKWMQDSETVDLDSESVNHQFQKVRTETNTSHVEEYGDLDIGNTKMSEVIGHRDEPLEYYSVNVTDAVSSHHVPIAILGQRIKFAKSVEEKISLRKTLHALIEGRKKIESFFMTLISHVVPTKYFDETLSKRPPLTKKNVACFEKTLDNVIKECFSISQNPYSASHLYKLINLCERVSENVMAEKISTLCKKEPRLHGIV